MKAEGETLYLDILQHYHHEYCEQSKQRNTRRTNKSSFWSEKIYIFYLINKTPKEKLSVKL